MVATHARLMNKRYSTPLLLSHQSSIDGFQGSNIFVPTNFKYISPQRKCNNEESYGRYPYHRNRALPQRRRLNTGFEKTREVSLELHSPDHHLTFRDIDVDEHGDEDDPMLSNSFRTKRSFNYYSYEPPPRRDRYSNVYEYTLPWDLSSITEDFSLDSS